MQKAGHLWDGLLFLTLYILFMKRVKRKLSSQFEQSICGNLFYRKTSCILAYTLIKLIHRVIQTDGNFFHLNHLNAAVYHILVYYASAYTQMR